MARGEIKANSGLAPADSAVPMVSAELQPVWSKLAELLEDLYGHSGFGQIQITMRWLKKSRKEIILHCGKEYRFVVEARATSEDEDAPEGETPPAGAADGQEPEARR